MHFKNDFYSLLNLVNDPHATQFFSVSPYLLSLHAIHYDYCFAWNWMGFKLLLFYASLSKKRK